MLCVGCPKTVILYAEISLWKLFYPLWLIGVFSKASMTVHDIPDLHWGGGSLGSVVFSESFLESSINIQQKGKISSKWSQILIDPAKEIYFT